MPPVSDQPLNVETYNTLLTQLKWLETNACREQISEPHRVELRRDATVRFRMLLMGGM